MNNEKRRDIKNSEQVAEKMYDPSNYDSKNQTEKGLAITHEQASDDYMEGTIDGKIDDINDKDEVTSHDGENIPRKGYK